MNQQFNLLVSIYLYDSLYINFMLSIDYPKMVASKGVIRIRIEYNRIEYVYLSIKDAHDRQYNYMKITIFILIGMTRLIGFNIHDIQIHVNIQFCNQ